MRKATFLDKPPTLHDSFKVIKGKDFYSRFADFGFRQNKFIV